MKNRILLVLLAVMLALSVGHTGCGDEQVPGTTEYNLTIAGTDGGDSNCVPPLGCTCGEGTEDSGDLPVPQECLCAEGTVVRIEATPDPGYRFVSWCGDVETIANVKAAITTITMSGNYSITANFEAVPPTQYNVTISSTEGGGVINPGEGTFLYDEGLTVNLIANPEEGYRFVSWTGDVSTIGDANAASTTIAMNDNYSITANFEEIPLGQVALAISSTAGGSVTVPGEGSFLYDDGTLVSLVANPLSGYEFSSWTGDVSAVDNVNAASTTITMNDDYSIMANFEVIPPVQYTLTISSTAGVSVYTPGEGTFTYNAGTVVNLVAAPASCYYWNYWTGDVGTVANVSATSTTITVDDDYSILAVSGLSPAQELHQAQTAIIIALAASETGLLTAPSGNATAAWLGEAGTVYVTTGNVTYDAADYLPPGLLFRATYTVNGYGQILWGTCNGPGQWGSCVIWDSDCLCWEAA